MHPDSLSPSDLGAAQHSALPPALAARLANPVLPEPANTLDARFDALIQGYAAEIGQRAMTGDMDGLERARRFHAQVVALRDKWRDGSPSAVRVKKAKPEPAVAPAPAPAQPAAIAAE